MKPRVYGEETEYGGVFISHKDVSHKLADNFIERMLYQAERTSTFLNNGARMYKDLAHIEYATPECLSPIDVTIHSKAGEYILNALAKENTSAVEENTQHPLRGRVRFFRNNVDSSGEYYLLPHTFGCHENYSYDPEKFSDKDVADGANDVLTDLEQTPVAARRSRTLEYICDHLLSFLITRFLWASTGNLIRENGKKVYQLSQRIPFITQLSADSTTSGRGVFNFRDEPHAKNVGRLHLICGDANMSEYQTYLKYGVTGIVLGMIEDGYLFDHLHFKNGMNVLKHMNRTMNFHQTHEMEFGKPKTPLDIQQAYLECARQWSRTQENPEIFNVIDCWEETLVMIKEGDQALERRLDWVVKRKLIFDKAAHPKRKAGELQQINLQYHDIDPEKSIYYLLVNNGLMDTFLSHDDILNATRNAPEGSRAKTRQAILNYFSELQHRGFLIEYTNIKWDQISYYFTINSVDYPQVIELPHPHDTSADSIREINAAITRVLGRDPLPPDTSKAYSQHPP